MKEVPQNVSASVRRRNPHLYNYATGIAPTGEEVTIITKPKKRIRQSSKPLMNKLEFSFYSYLSAFYPSFSFHAQSIRFKLGNGIYYKPDLVCFGWGDKPRACCWEVKGPYAFRGGFENLKVAAHAYPEVEWRLAWKIGNEWQQQLVLP